MAVKDHPVRLGVPASEQSVLDKFQHAMFIKQDQLTARDLEKATSLKLSMKTHCHETTICFKWRRVLIQRVIIAANILLGFLKIYLQDYNLSLFHCSRSL